MKPVPPTLQAQILNHWTTRELPSDRFYFLGLKNHCGQWLQPWNKKKLASWKKSFDNPRQHIKKQRHHFANKGPYSQNYSFSSSHVQMWELDHKEGWALKNWRFWTVVLEKTFESPLDCKGIQPVHPKGDHSWVFIGIYKCESWAVKKAERWRIDAFSLVLEKTLEIQLGCKEIKPVNAEGN